MARRQHIAWVYDCLAGCLIVWLYGCLAVHLAKTWSWLANRSKRCGVVWCGVVWCGVVWCGVVRCGAITLEAVKGLAAFGQPA